MITTDSRIKASEGIESAELDGEAVLLDVESGQYYGLSTVGARIMALLKEPVSITTIITQVKSEYEVEEDRLSRDILAFLTEMEDRKLIQIVNGEVA